MTLFLQALGGINYLALFGIIVATEIGLCKFITTCTDDFRKQIDQLTNTNYKNIEATKTILKESIKLHQNMLS